MGLATSLRARTVSISQVRRLRLRKGCPFPSPPPSIPQWHSWHLTPHCPFLPQWSPRCTHSPILTGLFQNVCKAPAAAEPRHPPTLQEIKQKIDSYNTREKNCLGMKLVSRRRQLPPEAAWRRGQGNLGVRGRSAPPQSFPRASWSSADCSAPGQDLCPGSQWMGRRVNTSPCWRPAVKALQNLPGSREEGVKGDRRSRAGRVSKGPASQNRASE